MKLIKLQCAYRLRVSQYELQFTLLVPLIAVKFSAGIVVIHLTALYIHLGGEVGICNTSIQERLVY